MLERKLASTGDQTRNHQVMSPTCSLTTEPPGWDERIHSSLTSENCFHGGYVAKQLNALEENCV